MRSGRTQEQLDGLAHRRYVLWATGDGAKTEFAIGKTLTRSDDLVVAVAGAIMRPSASGTAFDYSVRGITAGYAGDRNTVKFAAAPALNANICFIVNAD